MHASIRICNHLHVLQDLNNILHLETEWCPSSERICVLDFIIVETTDLSFTMRIQFSIPYIHSKPLRESNGMTAPAHCLRTIEQSTSPTKLETSLNWRKNSQTWNSLHWSSIQYVLEGCLRSLSRVKNFKWTTSPLRLQKWKTNLNFRKNSQNFINILHWSIYIQYVLEGWLRSLSTSPPRFI